MATNRVQVAWTGTPIVGGGLSTFYFNQSVGTQAQQHAAVTAFLTATDGRRSTSVSWAVLPDVATLDTVTGTLVTIVSVTQTTGTGSGVGDLIPPASQGLLRLLTSAVVGGHLLRGRLFLPGAFEGDSSSAGAPVAGYISGYNTAAATLISDVNSEWVIWSKTHGAQSAVSAASTWTKWATLRSRRD